MPYFLASGGMLVQAHGGTTVILDPSWLADTLACVISVDPGRLRDLPAALTQRGMLRHGDATLAAVWPDARRYTSALRGTLLSLLHRFDLVIELHDGSGASLGYIAQYVAGPCAGRVTG
jgi:hypothetical protein